MVFFFHMEVASDSFSFLIYSSWLLVFILGVFYLFLSGFNSYCWKGIHFSQNLDLIFLLFLFGLIIKIHFWFRDLLRELQKRSEVLLIMSGISSCLTSLNFWTTILNLRSYYLTLKTMPLFPLRLVIIDDTVNAWSG